METLIRTSELGRLAHQDKTFDDLVCVAHRKFGKVRQSDLEFFSGKYMRVNNRVLAIIDFFGIDNDQFLTELAFSMYLMPETLVRRRINPYFAFTRDLLQNSCVFLATKDTCGHTWCTKFRDPAIMVTMADAMYIPIRHKYLSVDKILAIF